VLQATLLFAGSELKPFQEGESILVLAPHPDDETLGCAGVIQEALTEGCSVHIVFLTNGDHNQMASKLYTKKIVMTPSGYIKMGKLRRKEAIAAAQVLGVPEKDLIFLGYPDSGTLKIWEERWGNASAYRNPLTRANKVPYPENYSYQAEYKGENILRDLESILMKLRPTRVFVSHPADTNVDHRALYVFLRVALLNLEGKIPPPLVYPYLIHFGRWPYPFHYHPELTLSPPKKLAESEIAWENYNLSGFQEDKKLAAIKCYQSQKVDRGYWLASFIKKNEIFGDYPIINLAKKPLTEKEVSIGDLGEGDFSPEELAEKSKISSFSFQQNDQKLLLTVKFNKVLEKEIGFSLHIFGYNQQSPFSQMPKISLRLVPLERTILRNGLSVLPGKNVSVKKNGKEVSFEFPIELLRNPDYILLALESYLGEIPVDLTAWRIIKIK